jgi:hypothetical protein
MRTLGEMHVLESGLDMVLVEPTVARVGKDLVDATPRHDVAGQEESDSVGVRSTARDHLLRLNLEAAPARAHSCRNASLFSPKENYIGPSLDLLITVNVSSLRFIFSGLAAIAWSLGG